MNMHTKRLIYATVLMILTLLTSCDSLLDIPPQGKLDSERFWLSKDQCVAAIAGIYSNLEEAMEAMRPQMRGLELDRLAALE